MRQQAGQKCGVHPRGVGGFGVVGLLDAQIARDAAQLPGEVLPLADAQVVQELLATHPPKRVAGALFPLLTQVAPEVQKGDEIGVFVGEAGVLLPRRLFAVGRPLPRVGDRQRRGEHEDLAHASLAVSLQDHPAQPRVDGQLRQPAPHVGDRTVAARIAASGGGVEGAEFGQQHHPVADAAPLRRVEKREGLDVAEVERRHLQDHCSEIGPQDLRVGVARSRREVIFGVQPDTDAWRGAARPPGSLRGGRLRDGFDRQPLHLGAPAVARDACGAGVDDVADARDRQRCLGDVGGQHDSAHGAARREDALLLGGGQPGVEREHLGVIIDSATQCFTGIADFTLARQEHQHVAGGFGGEFVNGVDDGLGLVAHLAAHDFVVGVVGIVGVVGWDGDFQWPVTNLDRIGPPGHLDDRGACEMCGEPLRFDRRRRDDHLQVGPSGQQFAEVAQQEIDVEAALVGLVEDEGVVAQQPAIALDLGEQDAVGHQLDQRGITGLIGEPDGVADCLAERGAEFVGDALGDRARGEPTRLGMADGAADAAAELETDLGQLSRLARTRLARDDDDLVFADGPGDFVAPLADRKVGVGDRRHSGGARGDECLGRGDLLGDPPRLGWVRAANGFQPSPQASRVADRQPVETGAQFAARRLGHPVNNMYRWTR